MTAPRGEERPAPSGPSSSPARRRLGCWGWGAITCGSLVLIFAVFLGTVLWLLRPHLPDIWESGRLTTRCAQNLQAIHGALERYRAARGAYPARLTDLRAEYLSRAETLRCPADTEGAGPTSYQYTPPVPPPRTGPPPQPDPVVVCEHHRLEVMGQTALNVLRLMPDGKIRQETVILSAAPEGSPRPRDGGAGGNGG